MKSMRNFLRGIIFFGTIHTSMCGFSQVRLTIATNRRSVTVPLISKETAVFAAGVAAISYSAYKMVQSWHARSHQQKKMQAQEALFRACKEGNRIEAEAALQAGAEINVPFSNGDTPLITAAIFKPGKLVQRLLKLGADCTICNAQGLYALDHAQQYAQHDETIASLLKNAARVLCGMLLCIKPLMKCKLHLKLVPMFMKLMLRGFRCSRLLLFY